MIRGVLFLLSVLAVAAAAAWLSDQPGSVSLTWRGWRVDTSAVVLAGAVAAVAVLVALLYRLWRGAVTMPAIIGDTWRRGRRRKGYLALTRGMVAVAAGDGAEALKNAKRARGLLNDPPLTLLLEAQSAQLNGDARAAETFFTRMLDDPEMAFLGLRGLHNQALQRADREAALGFARRARELRPDSDWARRAAFDLEVGAGDWAAAERNLKTPAFRLFGRTDTDDRRRAILEIMRAGDAEKAGNAEAALAHAKEAFGLAPGLAPVAAAYARLLLAAGRGKKAMAAIEKAWRADPHPGLADLYADASGKPDAVERMRMLERLGGVNPDHAETRLMLARAARAARLWGEARRHLDALGVFAEGAPVAPDQRAFRLAADLAEGEGASPARTRELLARAASLSRPGWVCEACGNAPGETLADWAPTCARCGGFDTFRFGPAPKVMPGAASVLRPISKD